jgi:hypothetical protein
MKRFLMLGCLVSLCMMLFSTQGRNVALTSKTPIDSLLDMPVEPIIIINANRQNKRLSVDNHWLDSCDVQVKNISDKTIKYLQVKVWFPDAKSQPPRISLPFTYGQVSASNSKLKSTESLRPGEKARLTAPRTKCNEIKNQLLRSSYTPSSASELKAEVSFVIFDDETAWAYGRLHYPEPNVPLSWIVAEDLSRGTTLNGDLLVKTSYKAGNSSNALSVPVSPQTCYRTNGFRLDFCCSSDAGDYYIGSFKFAPDPNGHVQPREATACCPQAPNECCSYIDIAPCP